MADIRGTSPKVWNAWKGKLLEDLYRLTLAALGGAHADAHTVLAERKEEAARLTRRAGLRDDAREAFWNQLDVAYFLRHDASDIAWHTRHLYHQVTPAEPVVRARPTEQGEGLQIMVYTRDVPDLFVAICAYFAAKSLSIQDARIHTTRHGWALDSFIVLLPEGDADLRAQATLVEHELAERLKAPAATAQQPAHTGGYYGRARQSRVFTRVSRHAPGRTAARRAQQVLAPVSDRHRPRRPAARAGAGIRAARGEPAHGQDHDAG